MAVFDVPFSSPNRRRGFTVFARLAYIYCGERPSRPPRPENQRDDREADSRCGPNPQRGEPSCRSPPRISSPLPAFSPPVISGVATGGALKFHLILLRSRAFIDRKLTTARKETVVEVTVEQQIEDLGRMTVAQLRQKYLEVFGEESRSNHKQYLFRRIAWRIQALAEGGLSERARRRAMELANDADLRIRAPKRNSAAERALSGGYLSVTAKVPKALDGRLPPPGAWLEREYRGQRVAVKIRVDGFEFEGKLYKSLSAVVNQATGGRWNGFKFFGLPAPEEAQGAEK
jgi:hypothetical protein